MTLQYTILNFFLTDVTTTVWVDGLFKWKWIRLTNKMLQLKHLSGYVLKWFDYGSAIL